MSAHSEVYQHLRKKLDVLGYTQTLPLAGIPIVGALIEDLIRTTESLRDSKQKIIELLEEKSCWELGTEAYRCDNARLIAECNQLHRLNIQQQEDYEQCLCENNQKIRTLRNQKQHLEEQCESLQLQIKSLLSKTTSSTKVSAINMKYGKDVRKPFVSTVRSGGELPPVKHIPDEINGVRCVKCQTSSKPQTLAEQNFLKANLEKLENSIKDLNEEIEYYKRKVAARDREINRLNGLLAGGRPRAALAKDCCYKDINALTEDLKHLQREKSEIDNKLHQYEDQMHEAMTRALKLEKQNKDLIKELDELKKTALEVENQANCEISEREYEIEKLKVALNKVKNQNSTHTDARNADIGSGDNFCVSEHRQLSEHVNQLMRKDACLRSENEKLHRKLHKLMDTITTLQKEQVDNVKQKENSLDEEKIRLKSERDFFQKEYLRLMSKAGSDKEVEFLQSQIKSKDEELRSLRSELSIRPQIPLPTTDLQECPSKPLINNCTLEPLSARSTTSVQSDCIQAAVLRAERERDCVRAELERVRCERDTLREKHLSIKQLQMEEAQHAQNQLDALNARIKELERENHELNAIRAPTETQIMIHREEIENLKRRTHALQEENCNLKTSYEQMKNLSQQTERVLAEYQNKLILTERELKNADMRIVSLDSNREATNNEAIQLRSEVAALKKTYVSLENEKDKILNQLDLKTERAFQLEFQLKSCQEKRINLEKQVKELEEQLENLNAKTRERSVEFQETSMERQSLRQQITALKQSRDAAIAENGRLSDELSSSQAEILMLKRKLKDSEQEIDRLKNQLHTYVQEVKKAEDLLNAKEKEREEMLEHYRSLSHDAVLLEGNNQSLEVEAAEYKQQISELETEIEELKKEICCRNCIIEQLEDKNSALTKQNSKLEHQLEEALDEQRLLKVDLSVRKELCEKLDVQKDKLNAELMEFNEIRRKVKIFNQDTLVLELPDDDCLENENERLRSDIEKYTHDLKASSESFEELLSKTRRDLEEQIQMDSKLSQELIRMREKNDHLLTELGAERKKRERQELVAKEFQVQNQELRHDIIDNRFHQARSREHSPRFPTHTL